MEAFSDFKNIVLSKSTINSKYQSSQPRMSFDKSRRTIPTSMDDLVPQRSTRKSSNRSSTFTNSP